MSSLMDVVLKTLPFAALEGTLRAGGAGGAGPALKDATGADLSGRLEFLPPGGSRTISPPHHTRPQGSNFTKDFDLNKDFEIWGYEAGANLEEVTDITCRVWSEDYDQFVVLDALRFGYEEPPGKTGGGSPNPLQQFVRAYDTGGAKIDLPLTKDFLKQQWLVSNVTLPAGTKDPFWKLETPVDKAVVRVFVYEFIGTSKTPLPLEGEDAEKDGFAKVDAACQAMASANIPDGVAADLFADTTFFPDDLGTGQTAETGGSAAAQPNRNRIVVVLSWTLCKAMCDFAPGGAIPMGRLYPHAFIMANAGYGAFELSIQLDRPPQSDNKDKPGEGCACSEMLNEMTSVLVTETNDEEVFVSLPVPVWCNLFTYYQVAPEKNGLNAARMAMVRADRRYDRMPTGSQDGYVTRRWGPLTETEQWKIRRQGEFDNIHMAPPMKCKSISYLKMPTDLSFTPISQAPAIKATLDNVWMAPFCAHDCFHLHWRWADTYGGGATGALVGGPQFLGWGDEGPCTTPGTPMVPLNQSVDLWYRSASTFTYHVFAGNHAHNPRCDASVPEAKVDLSPGTQVIACYHGAAYGLNAEYWLGYLATSMPGLLNQFGEIHFFDASYVPVTALDSWALFYWRLRYNASWDDALQQYVPYERTDATTPPNSLAKARDL